MWDAVVQDEPVRVAFVGKGGAGKSMIAGTLARLLARLDRKVLAADLDANPGLQFSLGLGAAMEAGLPDEAVEEHEGSVYGWRLAGGMGAADAVHRFAVEAPDGVKYLSINKIHPEHSGRPKRSITAVRGILAGFAEPGWDVIGDLEAGTTTPFERYHGFADLALVVVNQSESSALAARRILPLVDDVRVEVVANRWNGGPDHHGFPAAVRIPFDPAVAEAERAGLAPLDHCAGSPAVRAVAELAEKLLAMTTGGPR